MRKSRLVVVTLPLILLVLAGCSILNSSDTGRGTKPGATGTDIDLNDGEPRVITGQEALELYGAVESAEEIAAQIPEEWFPIQVWVTESVLPYDPKETIRIVAVFSRPDLSGGGTWLGDIEAGSEVTLFSIFEDGSTCYIEGEAVQGWTAKGWVACNRLSFTKDVNSTN